MNTIANKTAVEDRVAHILNTHGIPYTLRFDGNGHIIINMNAADLTSTLWAELKTIEKGG